MAVLIYFYTGVPGSGKSYHMAVTIYRYLSRGKNVISNFLVNYDQVKCKNPGKFIYVSNSREGVSYYLRSSVPIFFFYLSF